MTAVRSPQDELDDLFSRALPDVTGGLRQMARGQLEEDPAKRLRGLRRFADAVRWAQAVADVLGRRRILLETVAEEPEAVTEPFLFSLAYAVKPEVPRLPRVPFEEALEALAARMPTGIAEELRTKAERVAEVFNLDHGFALARVADARIADRIRRLIERAVEEGRPRPQVSEAIADLADFDLAYANTVFRTNVNTAYTAGRFQQAAEPFVRDVMPAFRFLAVSDPDVRRGRRQDGGENHLALDGMIAATNWAGWSRWAPPLGYNCRCTIQLISRATVAQAGLLDELGTVREPSVSAAAAHHPNFGGPRPDQALYFGIRA